MEPDVDPPPLAPRSLRLAAAIVDFTLSLGPMTMLLVAVWPVLRIVTLTFINGEAPEQSVARLLGGTVATASFGLMAVGIALATALSVWQWFLLATTGATVGKRLAGVRVVAFADGSRAGFTRAVALRIWGFGVICMIPYIGWVVGLADVVPVFFPNRRCLHDYFAGTRVVQPRAPSMRALIALCAAAVLLAALVAIASAGALRAADAATPAPVVVTAPPQPPAPPPAPPTPPPPPPEDTGGIWVYTDDDGVPNIVQGKKNVPEKFRDTAVRK